LIIGAFLCAFSIFILGAQRANSDRNLATNEEYSIDR
jgi:hypothetical protein